MPQDHWSPGPEVVQVTVAIGVPQIGSFGSYQERRISPDGSKSAYRGIHPTRQVLLRTLLQFLGTAEFTAHGIQYRGPCSRPVCDVKLAVPWGSIPSHRNTSSQLNLEEPCQNRRE